MLATMSSRRMVASKSSGLVSFQLLKLIFSRAPFWLNESTPSSPASTTSSSILPDSNIARSFPSVAGTLTTSMPVAFVNGSKIAFTLASSYDPPIVRMTTLPAAPARGIQTNGPVAATAAPARNVRREILVRLPARDAVTPAALPRSVRSIIGLPSCARGVPGALNRRASGRVVGIVGGTSSLSSTQPSRVSSRHWANLLRQINSALASRRSRSARNATFSVACNAQRTYRYASHCCLPRASSGSQLGPVLPAAVEPVLEALPVHHQRHGGQTPGVERHRREGRHRPAHAGRRCAEGAVGEQLAHDRGHGHAAPVVAEPDQHAGPRLVQMRQVIGGERHPSAPAVLPVRR